MYCIMFRQGAVNAMFMMHLNARQGTVYQQFRDFNLCIFLHVQLDLIRSSLYNNFLYHTGTLGPIILYTSCLHKCKSMRRQGDVH